MPISPGFIANSRAQAPFTADTLILHFDGSDGGTTYTDSGPLSLTVTRLSLSELDTAQQQFGTASMLMTSNGDGAELAVSGDRWHLTSDSSFEMFVRFNVLPSVAADDGTLMTTRRPAASSRGFSFLVNTSDQLQMVMWDGTGSVVLNITGTTALSVNTWYHVGVSRTSGGLVEVYLDGSVEVSGTPSGTTTDGFELTIGHDATSVTRFVDGWIDEVAVNKTAARDLSIVPTVPFVVP
jgi:hypothetical protein